MKILNMIIKAILIAVCINIYLLTFDLFVYQTNLWTFILCGICGFFFVSTFYWLFVTHKS